jgi:hypothetical protein
MLTLSLARQVLRFAVLAFLEPDETGVVGLAYLLQHPVHDG